MNVKYDELEAFIQVQKEGSFSLAASKLGISQPALSQKIGRLEGTLKSAVFIRQHRGLGLTSSGEKLLIYAKEAMKMQEDFLSGFDQFQTDVAGVIRIAGFSSIMRSVVLPRLATYMRKNPKASIELSSHEMFELPDILKSNQTDFIITDYFPHLPQCEEIQIAQEEYVIIEPKKYSIKENIFIDHGPFDNATESYLKFIGDNKPFKRIFLGDVYSIIDGVASGLGKAVMSKHLIEGDKRFKIIQAKKKYIRPVVLSYFKQSYYGKLHLEIIKKLNEFRK